MKNMLCMTLIITSMASSVFAVQSSLSLKNQLNQAMSGISTHGNILLAGTNISTFNALKKALAGTKEYVAYHGGKLVNSMTSAEQSWLSLINFLTIFENYIGKNVFNSPAPRDYSTLVQALGAGIGNSQTQDNFKKVLINQLQDIVIPNFKEIMENKAKLETLISVYYNSLKSQGMSDGLQSPTGEKVLQRVSPSIIEISETMKSSQKSKLAPLRALELVIITIQNLLQVSTASIRSYIQLADKALELLNHQYQTLLSQYVNVLSTAPKSEVTNMTKPIIAKKESLEKTISTIKQTIADLSALLK